MLSFGHALYVAVGVYATSILVNRGWPLWSAILAALLGAALLALLLGAVALRTSGIAFAMVTLAFAQVGAILVAQNPAGSPAARRGCRWTARCCRPRWWG
jgi:branched-chain amino acid transport system permease protein